MTITIRLPFPPSTNNLFLTTKYGRARTQKYDSWIIEAGNEILRQRIKKVSGPVVLFFQFQENRKPRRPRDVTNLIKAPEDLLVKHGIIESDDNSIVRGVEAYWADTAEGCEVTIVPVALSPASQGATGQGGSDGTQ